jgi:glycosyltransferase involved in cell wall biosynthesis
MPALQIVRIITRLNIGGPSIQAINLSEQLGEQGFETHLIHGALGAAEGDMRYLLGATVDATYLPRLQRPIAPASDAIALAQIFQLLCRLRPAIVHTHMAKAGTLGRLAATAYNRTAGRRSPARLVHTYHGHVLEGYFSRRKTEAFIAVERRLARFTDRIVAISPQIRRELVETYRIGRLEQYAVVPLGFDLEPFARIGDAERRNARRALQLPDEALVVTTVGRLTAIKQHDLFLNMAKLVRAQQPNAHFLIAGDGELRHELERLARANGLESSVHFLGWRKDLATIYGATDVFALTSRNEGTPVALIEAMASGVPGVSTDVGGVSDVMPTDDLGLRVADGRADLLADAIGRIIQSGRQRAMGDAARHSVLERYSLTRLVTDITHLYRALLSPGI